MFSFTSYDAHTGCLSLFKAPLVVSKRTSPSRVAALLHLTKTGMSVGAALAELKAEVRERTRARHESIALKRDRLPSISIEETVDQHLLVKEPESDLEADDVHMARKPRGHKRTTSVASTQCSPGQSASPPPADEQAFPALPPPAITQSTNSHLSIRTRQARLEAHSIDTEVTGSESLDSCEEEWLVIPSAALEETVEQPVEQPLEDVSEEVQAAANELAVFMLDEGEDIEEWEAAQMTTTTTDEQEADEEEPCAEVVEEPSKVRSYAALLQSLREDTSDGGVMRKQAKAQPARLPWRMTATAVKAPAPAVACDSAATVAMDVLDAKMDFDVARLRGVALDGPSVNRGHKGTRKVSQRHRKPAF